MDELETLELLSLVSKVTSELQNHLGVSDKTLAEFVIDLHTKCSSLPEFETKLEEMGAEFPLSLIESIDRLVHTMHPKFKGRKGTNGSKAQNGTSRASAKDQLFRGLAMPDKEVPWEDELEKEYSNGKSGPGTDAIDDTLALLEGLESKAKSSKVEHRRSMSPREDRGRSGRTRHRSRSRSGDGLRRRKRNDYEEEDEYGRSRKSHKSSRRRREDDQFKRPPTPEIDDEVILFKIYEGHVTGVMDYGAFVNIHGIRGKVDGLVHVSALVEGQRVNHPSDLVSRGQNVKVKVVKIEGSKIGLSMKDVDQESGLDLAPQTRIQSGANSEMLGGGKNQYGLLEDAPMVPEAGFTNNNWKKKTKRMTSPERWEIRQLIASGVVKASDYPELDEDYNATLNGEGQMELEQEVDIELREDEPPFLAGQTKQSLELSPIRVVKAPDGSLFRAAESTKATMKDRQMLKRQEDKDKAAQEVSKVDLAAQWQDPMANPDVRQFASDLRTARPNASNDEVPEWKRIAQNRDAPKGRRTDMPMKQQKEGLPVFQFRSKLIEAVKENQLLIVVGDTGSGKTTQLTQYLAEAGFANNGIIGCTQPRRVAATSVAKRVAEEVGCQLGQEVGYSVRFDECNSRETKIQYMTDGKLLKEALMDKDLKRYSVIMLDEAHERTVATDCLFALLKKALKRRPDLKLIVTSATLDAGKFSEYFNECPIFSIPGRTYPVEIMYSLEAVEDYVEAATNAVMEIHLNEPVGDILLFFTGREEIEATCETLHKMMKALGPTVPELIILPMYSSLPEENQSKIFDPAPPGARKVVIATNIAETSITIDLIKYVIDPGFVKQSAYDPRLGMDSLVVTPISQAQAKQRAGRAGRTGPGKCFRLYTEAAFNSEMLPTSIPEIQRQNLSSTILTLKAMGINDLLHFDFMDPPPTNTMLSALEELYALSALDDEGLLTRLGRKMADFPMRPSDSKALIAAVDLGCSEEIVTIVGLLNAGGEIFFRPRGEKEAQAQQKKAKFHDQHGDHLTYLNVYNGWKQSKFAKAWCSENFINDKTLKRAKDVKDQLLKIMTGHKLPIISCGRDTQRVRRAFCSGFFRNTARKDPQEGYKTLIEGTPVSLYPASSLWGKNAEWVMYNTLMMTNKEYMQCTSIIEPKWLVEAAPTFFKVAPTDKLSKRQKAERIEPLYNKFATEDDWRLSAQKRQGRGGGGGTWG